MGGFYGSIHVRTENRDAVRAAVEVLRCEGVSKFFLAPAIDGWVTVYPEQNGQESAVAEALSLKLPEIVLIHCMVHDDDLFAYSVFENGRVVDAYNSCPEYFGDEDAPERGGNAQTLKHLLVEPEKVDDLQRLLDAERFTFELERPDRFADFLGLPNTASAYEYLKEGETEGVREWKKFIHIPDLTLEKERRKAAAAQERALIKQLKSEGVLLLYEVGPKTGDGRIITYPSWAINPKNSKLLCSWHVYSNAAERAWYQTCGPDWRTEPIEFPGTEPPIEIVYSQSGEFLAMRSGDGSEIRIVNAPENRILFQRKFHGAVRAMAFSGDESCLMAIVDDQNGQTQLNRLPIRSGLEERVLSHSLAHFQTVVSDPTGRWAAVIDNYGILILIDVVKWSILNEVWIKEMNPSLPQNISQEIIADAIESMAKTLETIIPAERLAGYHQESARHFLPKEPIRTVVFSPDGSWLFCATTGGVRGLELKDVIQCRSMAAVPVRCSADAEVAPVDFGSLGIREDKYLYDVVYDALGGRVLFCGIQGKVFYLDVTNERQGCLVTGPGQVPLFRLALTPERSALVVSGHSLSQGYRRKKTSNLQVWNYAELCRRAGLKH